MQTGGHLMPPGCQTDLRQNPAWTETDPRHNSDRIKTTPDGKMFYSIKYGKNLMGAYGTTLTPEEIWKVVHYIHSVNGTSPFALSSSK